MSVVSHGSRRLSTKTFNRANISAILSLNPLLINAYLAVAGGGGGGIGGGGGAGGFINSASPFTLYSPLTITIGGGGTGKNGPGTWNQSGLGTNTTVISNGIGNPISITAVGGGGGSTANTLSGGGIIAPGPAQHYQGQNGGSGGGSGGNADTVGPVTSGGTGYGYPSPTQQGYPGGPNTIAGGSPSGGGGGAGAAGTVQAGGIGAVSSISGSPTYYAGGGGGGSYNQGGGTGGTGGGGPGTDGATNATAGTANRGGGGGGNSGTGTSGGGGSGIFVLTYTSLAQVGNGGIVTSTGSGPTTTWIHTFNSSNTFTF